jgi:hypothetical protein
MKNLINIARSFSSDNVTNSKVALEIAKPCPQQASASNKII